ncbi:BTAD domain-containing putative transcriptional regulator [Kitasatospora sp. MAP5-34]|uniref:AfsR/SARP family transcriptional regulator n=1 Tax=Kitasatospora sp. MAP5-34 TaxID=3035102 RepID=UPI002474E065|nr:BTAD domain-containing putative transcriptional regulator [Kitasatospora sp. MAP5-34]MDH6577635.1 DNA-binding SARP family transcriptional activator [Kitasatospora sp. MAP5-34]
MDDLWFSVLGPVRGGRGEAALRLGSPQQRATLAVLLLRPGRSAGAADLVDALWGEEPPNAAVSTIRTYVWRLRKILRTAPDAPDTVISLGDGYRLQLSELSVDSLWAEELAAQADRTKAEGKPGQARELLNRALALWEGEPLAGLPGPFAERQRRRLADLRLTLAEERLALDLALGDSSRCISELTALTAEHPLRERSYGLLMRALFQAQRPADALAVYRTARQLLIDELGVEPGPELGVLHQRILDGDPGLLTPPPHTAALPAGTRATVPPRAAEHEPPADDQVLPRPSQLPPDTSDFTGREAEVDALLAVLRGTGRSALAVAAVAGMGGVGKTALAVHVAHRARTSFPDGQLYADLRGGDPAPAAPEAVLAGFLGALGVPAEAVPDGLDTRSALFRSLVADRRLLILLDNARNSAQLRPLLPGAAGCAVLVTSRTRLAGPSCALQVDLPVFQPVEAVELLGRTIGADRLDGERHAAIGLVSACGFLPLAVRIVAARLTARPSWTMHALTVRLADELRRIDELRIGDLGVEAVFELGYRQLAPDQAEAFRLVATVDGTDIALASAAALLAMDELAAEDLMESLVDAAMLQSPSPGRYCYHDLLRNFARRKSAAAGPAAAVEARSRLLSSLLGTACAAFQHAVPGDPVGSVLGSGNPAGPGFPDLGTARAWAIGEAGNAVALAAQVARSGSATGLEVVAHRTSGATPGATSDGGSAAEPVTASGQQDELRAAIDLLIALSPFGPDPRQGQLVDTARELVNTAVLCGDRHAEGRARFLCGNIAVPATRFAEAEVETRLAIEACREVGDTVILRQALNDLGLLTQYLGRYDEAIDHFDEAIAIARQLGHRSGGVTSTINAALARVRSGRAAEALPTCRSLLAGLRAEGDEAGTAYALYVLGLASHELGCYPAAAGHFTECLRLSEEARLPLRALHARYRLADTLRALGEPEQAVAQAERALELCDEIGTERDRGHILLALGRALSEIGRTEPACQRLGQAQAVFAALGLPDAEGAARSLENLTAPSVVLASAPAAG